MTDHADARDPADLGGAGPSVEAGDDPADPGPAGGGGGPESLQQAPQEIPVPPWMAAGDGVAGPGPEPAEGPGSPATPDGLERGTYPDGTDYGPGRAPIAIADLPDALDEPDEPAGAGAGADGPADPVTQVDSERDPSAGCRYLVAASGGWRASDAIRDHRCTALDPAAPIALDKQRRLCLTATHPTCPTFIAARDERGRALDPVASAWSPARPVVGMGQSSPSFDRALIGRIYSKDLIEHVRTLPQPAGDIQGVTAQAGADLRFPEKVFGFAQCEFRLLSFGDIAYQGPDAIPSLGFDGE